MTIGAFDQAPVGIGFAFGEPGSTPTFGYHENPNYGDNSARLAVHVFDWATNHIRSAGIESVWCEQIIVPQSLAGPARHPRPKHHARLDANVLDRQYATRSAIQLAAARLGLVDECYEALIADWRREFYAGKRPVKGQTWKELALIECARRNWLTDNHNVAEALGIWHWACFCLDRRYRSNAKIDTRRRQLQHERGALI